MNDMTSTWTTYDSPLGKLTLVAAGRRLRALRFPGAPPLDPSDRAPGVFDFATAQLDEYFAGERRTFDLDLELAGTSFQRRVWEALRQIPYGTIVSYSELAATIDRPDRVRAVGGAVGRTPIPIIVPCHRVLGADGSLTGYGGGLHRKGALLDLEGARWGPGLARKGQLTIV
jgi:methylated-DNA-[protein]-cysteine S-methyltransferase